MTNQGKLLQKHTSIYVLCVYLDLFFCQEITLTLDIRGSKLSFYCNIFLSKYRKQKCLVYNGPYWNYFMQ